jgi:hypothetical protein
MVFVEVEGGCRKVLKLAAMDCRGSEKAKKSQLSVVEELQNTSVEKRKNP